MSFVSGISFDGAAPSGLKFGFGATSNSNSSGGVSAQLGMSLDAIVKANKSERKAAAPKNAVPAPASREAKAAGKALDAKARRAEHVAAKRGIAAVPVAAGAVGKAEAVVVGLSSNQRKRLRKKKRDQARVEELNKAQKAARKAAAKLQKAPAKPPVASSSSASSSSSVKKDKKPQQQQQQQPKQQPKQSKTGLPSITVSVKNDRKAQAPPRQSGAERGAPKANVAAKFAAKKDDRQVRQVKRNTDARKSAAGARRAGGGPRK